MTDEMKRKLKESATRKKWYAKHAEEQKAKSREYYRTHKDEVAARRDGK